MRCLSFTIALVLSGCKDAGAPPAPLPDSLTLVSVATGLSAPLYLTAPAGVP